MSLTNASPSTSTTARCKTFRASIPAAHEKQPNPNNPSPYALTVRVCVFFVLPAVLQEETPEADLQSQLRLRIASWPPEDKAARCRGVSSCQCALHRFNSAETNLMGEDIQLMVIDAKEVRMFVRVCVGVPLSRSLPYDDGPRQNMDPKRARERA